MFKMTQRNNP